MATSRLGDPDVRPSPCDAAALARAEALFAEAAVEVSPFRADALLDEVTEIMARTCGATLWRFCAAWPGIDAATAEDLAQQALIGFREALPRFGRRSSLKTFLYGIAANLARATLTKTSRRERILASDQATVATLLHGAEDDSEAEARRERRRLALLEAALRELPARDAYIVRARLVDGLGYEQILPRFRARFGDAITTAEGLRTLFFHVKTRLRERLTEAP